MKPIAIISLVSVGYIFISLLSIGLLFSCSKEDQKVVTADYPQKWQLVKMTGAMINSETTGKDMDWQEYYLLNSDGTFLKSHERNGQLKQGSGTYMRGEKYISLTYTQGVELIASCTSAQNLEQLCIVSSTKMVGTWNACDGPGLEYQLVGQIVID